MGLFFNFFESTKGRLLFKIWWCLFSYQLLYRNIKFFILYPIVKFFNLASPGVFCFIFIFSIQLTVKKLIMTGFEPWISGVKKRPLFQQSHNHCPFARKVKAFDKGGGELISKFFSQHGFESESCYVGRCRKEAAILDEVSPEVFVYLDVTKGVLSTLTKEKLPSSAFTAEQIPTFKRNEKAATFTPPLSLFRFIYLSLSLTNNFT